MRGTLPIIAALAVLVTPAVGQSGRIERGRVFLQTHCAGCHAIGPVGASPLGVAPPLRTLHQRYPVETLAEALAEGLTTGHPTMPEFQLDPAQINDVLAYLKSLER
jgi:mono/diheme cytochrome c family protein